MKKVISNFNHFMQNKMNEKQKLVINGGTTPPNPPTGGGNDNTGKASNGGSLPFDGDEGEIFSLPPDGE